MNHGGAHRSSGQRLAGGAEMKEKKEDSKPISAADDNGKPEVYAVKRSRGDCDAGRRRFLASALGFAGAATAIAGTGATAQAAEAGKRVRVPVGPGSCQNGKAHSDDIKGVAFSKDGVAIASGSVDKMVKFWSVADGRLLKNFTLPGAVMVLHGSPDGKWVAVAQSKTIWLYAWVGMKLQKSKAMEGEIRDLAFSANGKRLVVLLSNNKICFLKVPILGQKGSFMLSDPTYGHNLAVSPDGKWLVVFGIGKSSRYLIKRFKTAKFAGTFDSNYQYIDGGAFSPDGKYLATFCTQGVEFWRTSSWKRTKLIGSSVWVNCLAFSPNGKQIAVGRNKDVIVYSFPKGKVIKTLIRSDPYGSTDHANAAAYNPTGALLAVGYAFGASQLRLWQPANGQILRCFADVYASYWYDELKSYEYKAADGSTVSVTYPNCSCASPPAGAKCTCDVVEGNLCGCVGHSCPCNVMHIYFYPN